MARKKSKKVKSGMMVEQHEEFNLQIAVDPFLGVVPSEKDKKEYEEWLGRQNESFQKVCRDNNLSQWRQFALENAPTRAHYYRIFEMLACASCKEMHIRLINFTHDGKIIMLVEGAKVEQLVDYPYSADNPPPAEEIELEKLIVAKTKEMKDLALKEMQEQVEKQIKAVLRGDLKTENVGMVKVDPLMMDERGGKDKGH